MNDIIPVWKKRKVGRPASYDPDIHLDMLFDVFTSGKGIIHFCAKANICEKTFHNWVHKHYLFKQAYELCLPKGSAKFQDEWEAEGKDANFQSKKFMYENRFGKLHRKIPRSKDKSLEAKYGCAWKALVNGMITPQEFNSLITGLAKLKELEIDKERLDIERENKVKEDVKNVPDDFVEKYMLVREGKAEIIVKEENK